MLFPRIYSIPTAFDIGKNINQRGAIKLNE